MEETPHKIFDEIFGEGWWDNDKNEEWNKLTLEHNFHHQIDRQKTKIGQIEPNSTDQLGQIEPNLTDQLGQIEPYSTDQLGQIEPNSTDQLGQIELNSTDQLGQIEPNSTDQLGQIEPNSTDQLGQIEPNSTDQNPPLTESDHSDNAKNVEEITSNEKQKFDQMKAELKRAGFKNSYPTQINETVAKELGITDRTIYNWKRKLGQTTPQHKYPHNEQKELMKRYYEIKGKNSKIRDEDIAKILKIGRTTLRRWQSQFKREQFYQNSVDGHFVEENAAANVQEIENSN
uniref:Uncharacterized protein n=1 Tax=Globodera rostochiensis TaxID=31243 RepID=A0A914HRR1_GLORO